MDGNDWCAPAGNVGSVDGFPAHALAEWQAATEADAGSISCDPLFRSGTDLHIRCASPCQGRGVSVWSASDDIDGDVRAEPPDIGCDENLLPSVSGTVMSLE